MRAPFVPALAFALAGSASARYVHTDPAGAHPGCLAANGDGQHDEGLPRTAPFNQSCPGLPMRDVYDWESEILPFNTQQITQGVTRFIEESGWNVPQFTAPRFGSAREDGDPPNSVTELSYAFPSFQSSEVTKDLDGLNVDLHLEAFTMYLNVETANLDAYLSSEDASGIQKPEDELRDALRDAFDQHRKARKVVPASETATPGSANPSRSLDALNKALETKILDLRVNQEGDAFRAYASSNGYGFLSGADVKDAVDDINGFNAANAASYETDYITAQNGRLQQFLNAQGLNRDVSATVDRSNFRDGGSINVDIKNQKKKAWKDARDADLSAYLRDNGLSNEGLPGIDVAINDERGWNAQAVSKARDKYLRDSNLRAQGVDAAQFGDGSSFNYSAYVVVGARYGGDPPAFSVTPAYADPPAFNLDAYDWNPYSLTKTHSHSPYSLSTPTGFNVTAFAWPRHIDKANFTALSVYHKHWYVQLGDRCQATCAGTQSTIANRDTDELAPDRTCDADDVVCPASNAAPGYDEFQGIIVALQGERAVHPECPVSDPCVVTPPPCFYVSTECVPREVVDIRMNNTDQRVAEQAGTPYKSIDDRYLHEPLELSEIVSWKLVSNRFDSAKFWDFNKGMVMDAYVSPVDNRPYHRTCTFGLTQREVKYYDRASEYGFSISETDQKELEGHTAEGQNSYKAPNHVYDVGHVPDKEMWQRSFGETVSPKLDDMCTGVFAGAWRNRAYDPPQTLGSENYVFGTCMKTCDAMAVLGRKTGEVIETYPAFLAASARAAAAATAAAAADASASLGKDVRRRKSPSGEVPVPAAKETESAVGGVVALVVGGIATVAIVAIAAVHAKGAVKRAEAYYEARAGSAEERLAISAV